MWKEKKQRKQLKNMVYEIFPNLGNKADMKNCFI